MMFVYPAFLWALTAISVPIIIHLFNFKRYKKVYFTNVRFLKELQLESQSKSRLKELLILLARILTITALVLAFAQPVLIDKAADKSNLSQKTVGIYIDNSFSMEAVNKQGPLLENAKILARNIVNAFKNNDKFHLITNEFKGKHQRVLSKDDVLQEIAEIKISPVTRKYSDVLTRQNEFLKQESSNIQLYAITDAQKSTFNIADIKNDSLTKVTIVPVFGAEIKNVFIDSCWFETPIQQKDIVQKLHVIIKNNSDKTIEAGTSRLMLNGTQVSIGSYSVESNDKKEMVLSFTSKNFGFNYATVKIDDYPITFDDEMHLAFNTKISINALIINGKENETQNYFNSLFANDSMFLFTELSENAIDFSKLKNADLVILNELSNISGGLLEELKKFALKGGCVVIIPPAKIDLNNYNNAFANFNLPIINNIDTQVVKLNKPEMNNPFFEGVFEKIDPQMNLPLINQHLVMQKNTLSNAQTIYSLVNANPFLIKNTFTNAQFFAFASSFSSKQSNFCKHALFVPTFIRFAVNSIKPQPIYYTINSANALLLKPENSFAENPPHIIGKSNKTDVIPEIKIANGNLALFTGDLINEAGFYDVVWQKEVKQNIAFNYNRAESITNLYNTDELNKIFTDNQLSKYKIIENAQEGDITKTIQMGATGIKLWKWLIILSLLFIAIEISLIRFLK